MHIRIGYELVYEFAQPAPMIVTLHVHPERAVDLLRPDTLQLDPPLPVRTYLDGFGNWCTRILAPPGTLRLTSDAVIRDSGLPDRQEPYAPQMPIDQLPQDTLVYLLPSRYCDSDELVQIAWQRFGQTPEGWPRVQAIVDFVHQYLRFGYEFARPTKTALQAYNEGAGVCRDFAHLAIAFCRALNIPARYCTGYLGDIGVPYNPAPMDFAGYFEAYLGAPGSGRWYAFDPRNHAPRIGRVLIARGRDAADAAITTTYAPHVLKQFKVWTDEVRG